MAETLPKALERELDVLMVDNFDSFTWNLYQQLCLQGAEVTVIRNDAISPSLFPQLKIKYLVVSPGPGHPKTDSGISNAAIEYFQGKVPVLAVQYHPESILSDGGNDLVKNFLSLRGGLWEENPEARVLDNTLPPFPVEVLPETLTSEPGATTKIPSILEKIYSQRLSDVAQAKKTPGSTLADLQTLLSL